MNFRATFWTPRSTILFMTDMKIDFNKFHRIFLPNISSKTIITENPVGREADVLRNYALTAPIQPTEILESLSYTIENSKWTYYNLQHLNLRNEYFS